MTLNYLLAECQSNTCTGNFLSVQTLKHAKYELGVRRVDTDAVIFHREQPFSGSSHTGNMDCERRLASIFDRIANQIMENLYQHGLLSYHGRQRIGGHRSAALLNARPKG